MSRRAGVFGAAAATLLVVGPAAAGASADEYDNFVEFSAPYQFSVLSAPDTGAAKARTLNLSMYSQGPADGKDVVVTLDTKKLAGIADATFPDYCKSAGTVVTCNVGTVPVHPPDTWRPTVTLPVELRGAKNAKPGAKGQLDYVSVTQSNGKSRTDAGFTEITVASGHDIVPGALPEIVRAEPGDIVDMPVSLTNVGNGSVKGIFLRMSTMDGAEFVNRYSNCRYDEGNFYGSGTTCLFPDLTVQPGETYALAAPEKFRVMPAATRAYANYTVGGVVDWDEFSTASPTDGTPGVGPELKLVRKASTSAKIAKDIDTGNNYAGLAIHTSLTTDLAAVGAGVPGAVGTTVQATIGIENLGPGRFTDRSGGEADYSVKVVIPEGATVTKVPENCGLSDGKDLGLDQKTPRFPGLEANGRPAYVCQWEGDYFAYPVGSKGLFAFDLKIDKVVPDAKGGIQITSARLDKNPGNNRAELVINPTKPPAGGTTGGTTGGAASGGEPPADNGPELAETGGSSSTPLIAGVAGGLLVVAAGAFVVARRRKGDGAAAV
ncbi:LAETG motif-containing sortase-dependent surface protein [Yinghuangia sp. YIM S09857]|uniref:LAETG motif-containing sortase-dependent surface protein n=1 Tax=Yinghuangia sp. YIM S09857 TaxID=3436929 RepID=UPI003F529962